jgi:hypothetical protein
MKPPAFTAQESQQAHALWQANCGPHALAAACGKSLDDVHKVLPNFRGWMSPYHLENALDQLNFGWQVEPNPFEPKDGILRIQWHGPWLSHERHPREAWPHTHWVACQAGHIHDIVFPDWVAQWIPLALWTPRITNFAQEKYQGWNFTDQYKIFQHP